MDGLNSVHWMKSLRIIFDNMSDLENKIDFDEVFLVIPAYNEEKTVSAIIEEIASQGYNVVLVNDGSKDNTLELAMQSQDKYPNKIFIVSHMINRGLGVLSGNALHSLKKASGHFHGSCHGVEVHSSFKFSCCRD